MTFSQALEAIKKCSIATRAGWNGKGMWIALETPEDEVKLPYIYMHTVDSKIVPWLASQTDLLADDWEVLP
jgi:hypothetical protein